MAIKTLVNLRRQAVPLILRDRANLSKTVQTQIGPRASLKVDEGLFTQHTKALLRQKHLKIKA